MIIRSVELICAVLLCYIASGLSTRIEIFVMTAVLQVQQWCHDIVDF